MNRDGFSIISLVLAIFISSIAAGIGISGLVSQQRHIAQILSSEGSFAATDLTVKLMRRHLKYAYQVDPEGPAGDRYKKLRIHYRRFDDAGNNMEVREVTYDVQDDICNYQGLEYACKKIVKEDVPTGDQFEIRGLTGVNFCVDDGSTPCPSFGKYEGTSKKRFVGRLEWIRFTRSQEGQVSQSDKNHVTFVTDFDNIPAETTVVQNQIQLIE